MQQVFLKLFTKIEQFRSEAEFTTWLYRLAANACIDEQRKRSRFTFFGDAFEMRHVREKKSQEDQFIRLEMAEAVQQAVAALRPKLRLAILLKYFEDLSYEEMAAVLGCSKGTVASRLIAATRFSRGVSDICTNAREREHNQTMYGKHVTETFRLLPRRTAAADCVVSLNIDRMQPGRKNSKRSNSAFA